MIGRLSLFSCRQRITVANGVMLFKKDIMLSTRQYETILRTKRSREEPRYWHAKNPVKLTILITEVFRISWGTRANISDNQEEDKLKKMLIGVVNYGFLEKEALTIFWTRIQDSRCLEKSFPAIYLCSSHRLPKQKPKTKKHNLWFQPDRLFFVFIEFFVFWFHSSNKQKTQGAFWCLLWSMQP